MNFIVAFVCVCMRYMYTRAICINTTLLHSLRSCMCRMSSRKPGTRSGRPERIARGSSAESLATEGCFNAKEISDFLSARVIRAQEAKATVYQGEQRAWGGSRPFNPVKDDFLQMVEIAIDSCKQNYGDS